MLVKRKKPYLRIWKYRLYTNHHLMRKMNTFRYRGFKVTIWDNHIYGFRYEWKIEPLTPSLLRMCGMKKILHDPTSARFRSGNFPGKPSAEYWAKDEIDLIHENRRIGYWLPR